MAPHKSNLAEKPASLTYRIVPSTAHDTACVERKGVTDHDANSLAAGSVSPHERTALGDAKEFLREELAEGAVMAKQVFKDARDAGHAEITVRRAKAELRVQSDRQGTEGWAWRLPDDEGDRDDRDEQDDHVDHDQDKAPENSPYLREDDQDDQGDHRDGDDHDSLSAGVTPGRQIVRLLREPPAWLARQLELCHEDRERHLRSTCSAIAAEIYGTATRAEEVEPVLVAHLEVGA